MKTLIVSLCLAGLGIPLLHAQGPAEERRGAIEERVEAQLVAFITQRLDLTPEESTKFWPIYNEYREKQTKLRKDAGISMRPGAITDEEANDLIRRQLDLEERQLALKKEYITKFRSAIPPRKIARLHHAEQAFKMEILERIRERRGRADQE